MKWHLGEAGGARVAEARVLGAGQRDGACGACGACGASGEMPVPALSAPAEGA